MRYVELVKEGLWNRGKIVPLQDVIGVTGSECYRSMCVYTAELLEYTRLNKTVEKYEGLHSTDMLLFDFDGAPAVHDAVRASTMKFVSALQIVYDIPVEFIYVSFSGNKGFHVALPVELLGDAIDYRKDFHVVYREFVKMVTTGHLFVDTGIYNPMRIIRLTNTKHGESGLYKIPITHKELFDLTIDIRVLAKKPRARDNFSYLSGSEAMESPALKAIWNQAIQKATATPVKAGGLVAGNNEFQKALSTRCDTGGRHELLTKIAGYLIDRSVGYDEAYAIAKIWDDNNITPMGDQRLERDLRGVYNSYWDRRPEQKKQKQKDEPIPIDKLLVYGDRYTKAYEDHIARISKFGRMKLGYDIVDDAIRGMIGGEVLTIVGKTSVGKSALAQNIGLNNTMFGRRVLFFSLEMPIATVAERNLQLMLRKSGRRIERECMEYPMILADIKNAHSKLDNFVTIPIQGIRYELIERYILETEQHFGEKIDLVLIDYAGLIKYDGGTLYEQQSGIAKDLKALSGRTETGIITLAQVSKQYKDTDPLDLDSTRDSGTVVEASDYLIGLWRANREYPNAVALDGAVLKNRNGSRVEFSATLHRESLIFNIYDRATPDYDQGENDTEPF